MASAAASSSSRYVAVAVQRDLRGGIAMALAHHLGMNPGEQGDRGRRMPQIMSVISGRPARRCKSGDHELIELDGTAHQTRQRIRTRRAGSPRLSASTPWPRDGAGEHQPFRGQGGPHAGSAWSWDRVDHRMARSSPGRPHSQDRGVPISATSRHLSQPVGPPQTGRQNEVPHRLEPVASMATMKWRT